MFDDSKFCYWKSLSNYESQWYTTDNESNYQNNLKLKYDELQYHEWIDSSFIYKFNSHGFRCPEFTNNNTIMFLGCSFTMGVGLPEDKSFPYMVSQQLNLNYANLGVAGSSADTAFRLSQIYLSKLQPKIVVSTLLFPERLELLSYDSAYSFTPNTKSKTATLKNYHAEYYKTWLQQKENAEINFIKNQLAITQSCNEYNVKHIILTMEDCKDFLFVGQKYSKARDLKHPGFLTHQHVSQLILNQL